MKRLIRNCLLLYIYIYIIGHLICIYCKANEDEDRATHDTRNISRESNIESIRFGNIKQLTEYDFSVDVLGRDVLYGSIVCVVNSMSRDVGVLAHYNVVARRFLGFEPPLEFFWIESKPPENHWILRQFRIEAVPEFLHVPPSTWGSKQFRVDLTKRFNDGIGDNVEWTTDRFVQELSEFVKNCGMRKASQVYFTWLQCITALVTCTVVSLVIVTFLWAYRRNRGRTILACALGVYVFSISCWIHSYVSGASWFRGVHAKTAKGVSSFMEGLAFASAIIIGAVVLHYDDYGYYSLLLLPLTLCLFCMYREGQLSPISATRAHLGSLFASWL